MRRHPSPRLSVRALILLDDRLLLVNAWGDARSDLWCAPGGGVELGQSLPANLAREVHEETGLTIAVGEPALVNEFHHPPSGFHQVEVFFRCDITGGTLSDTWLDPESVVTRRHFFPGRSLSKARSGSSPSAWPALPGARACSMTPWSFCRDEPRLRERGCRE